MSRVVRGWRGLACWAVIGAMAAGAAGAMAADSQGKLLRWKFKPGETLHYSSSQDINQKMMMGTNPVTITGNQTMDLEDKVQKVDANGVATIERMIVRIRMKMKSPQGVMLDYDSASPQEPAGMAKIIAPTLKSLVLMPMTFTMDSRGVIGTFELSRGFKDAISKMPGGGAGGGMSEGAMKQMSEIAVLPEEEVKEGKTWSRKTVLDLPNMGKKTFESSFKYVGTEKRGDKELDKIEVTTKMEPSGEKGASPLNIKEQDSKGTIWFDTAAGLLAESKTTMHMKAQAEVMGNTMDQDLETIQTMKLEPAETAKSGESKPAEVKPETPAAK